MRVIVRGAICLWTSERILTRVEVEYGDCRRRLACRSRRSRYFRVSITPEPLSCCRTWRSLLTRVVSKRGLCEARSGVRQYFLATATAGSLAAPHSSSTSRSVREGETVL